MRILMVEDEKYIALAVAKVMRKEGYAVDVVHDGEDGFYYATTGIYDVIVLDIMLPKIDGLTVLEKIRKKKINTAVILLTSKSEVEDRVRGLNLGADDYLAKPFHTDELIARIRALSRRAPDLLSGEILDYCGLELTMGSLTASFAGKEVELQPKEAQILELLILQKGNIVTKEYIMDKVWGYDAVAGSNSVEKRVSLLRQKLSQIDSNVFVRTVRGVGYAVEKCEDEQEEG